MTSSVQTMPSCDKVGLALSGGGARGLAHIGVLRVLEREGIPVDFLAGASMGGLIAAAYAAGLDPDFMEQEALRMASVRRLLALADAGQLYLHTAPLDLGPFLREMVETHQIQAQERGVDLALETPPSLPLVEADRDRLAQVMGNLLSNALRYVSEGGHVTVRAEAQGREVIVAVADDGPGIPPEDLPHLFERFWRGDRARRRATGGSGLGLTIARSLVEAHGGHLWAESVEGEGSTFAFALPVLVEA